MRLADERKHLVDEEERSVEVRAVVEHAVEDDRARVTLPGARLEIVDVDPVRDDCGRRLRSGGADDLLLACRCEHDAGHLAPGGLLVAADLRGLEGVEGPSERRALDLTRSRVVLVLDVVLVEHDLRLGREAERPHERRLELHDVERPFRGEPVDGRLHLGRARDVGLEGQAADERDQLVLAPDSARGPLAKNRLGVDSFLAEERDVRLVGARAVREQRHLVPAGQLPREVVDAHRPTPPRRVREPHPDHEDAQAVAAHPAKTRRR